MNKVKMLFVIIGIFCFFMMPYSFAANPKVQINGEIIDFTDSAGNKVEAQIINSRTMVPLRKIFEVLECNVDWDDSTKTVTATKNEITIVLQIGNKNATYKNSFIGEEKTITLDSEPVIVSNRTLVPFRFIGESLGMVVAWDSANSTAIIIDYESIAKLLKEKSNSLYVFGFGNDITVSKSYFDEISNENNNTSIRIYTGLLAPEDQMINISVEGDSEFATESKNEEWNDFSYFITMSGEAYSDNYVFSKLLDANKNEKKYLDYSKYNLSADQAYRLKDWIKALSIIDSNKIDVNTYGNLKKDWQKFANLFLSSEKRKLSHDNFEYTYIDFYKIINQRFCTPEFDTLLLLNQALLVLQLM